MLVKKVGAVTAAIAAAALIASCSSTSSTSTATSAAAQATGSTVSESAAGKKVGFMVFDQSLDTFVTVMAGAAEEAAKQAGLELTVVDGKNDLKTEQAAIDQFVADGVDAILVYPGDPKGVVPQVQAASDAGIPVFTVNLGLEEGAPVVTYIGSDDFVYGQEQGHLLADALGDKGGKIALATGEPGTSAEIKRTAGLKDALKMHPNITIVEEKADDWDPTKSEALVKEWVAKYPKGELAAIVAQGPQIVPGADWAKKNGRDEIVFIAGDYNKDVQKAIIDGSVYGTTDQDPKLQGTEAIAAIANWLGGKQALVQTPLHYLPLPVITKDNAASTAPAW